MLRTALASSLLVALAGCESGMPSNPDAFTPRVDAFMPPIDGGPGTDSGGSPDAAMPDSGGAPDGGGDAGPLRCEPAADDYMPRVMMSASDTWPSCISDDGIYHLIDPAGLSSQARVAAYDAIFHDTAAPLIYEGRDPSSADFTAARTIYNQPSGIGSRVNRRTDDHYPSVTGTCTVGASMLSGCQCPDVAAANPEFCVGPGTLLPIIQRGFREGQMASGAEPQRVHAARIDASILWFLYISPYKESLSCSRGADAKDCDSAWAYYTGQDATSSGDRGAGIGLAAIIESIEPAAHDRVWDGLLAVRCWRDLDRGTPPAGMLFGDATMAALRDRARAQTDRALLRGMAAIAIDVLERYRTASGADRAALLAFAQTWLAPIAATSLDVDDGTGTSVSYPIAARPSLFDRALRAASAADADFVAAQMMMSAPSDVDGIIAALERAFPCP